MFCLIRHAEYRHTTGFLTPEGSDYVKKLAEALVMVDSDWNKILTSDVTRTRETASILGETLGIPVEVDDRISMEGDLGDLLPPTDLRNLILVTHLPVITRMLRVWSRHFGQNEPPMIQHASGYIVDPEAKKISPITAPQ